MRAVVPLGFMPDLSRLADGVLEIVICSGDGMATLAVDAAGSPVSPGRTDPGPVQNGLCPFAATAALALATLAVVLFGAFRWPSRLLFSFRDETRLVSASRLGPLGPRAPPL